MTSHAGPTNVTQLSARKFYFLDYFYVLLKSAQTSQNADLVFSRFAALKQEYQLGESRYKRITVDADPLPNRMIRYQYTFSEVMSEAVDYNLISNSTGSIFLLAQGREAIDIYENEGVVQFYWFLARLMEEKYQAFRYVIETCYTANRDKAGLLVFPIYSARRLGIERDSIKTASDLRHYFLRLRTKLEQDILNYLGQRVDLTQKNDELLNSLLKAGLLPQKSSDAFEPYKYIAILKRSRDFWLKYFLQDLYHYTISLNSFDIWAYRGKQIGLLHITEFYPDPNFSGRVVYPLSVIKKKSNSETFVSIFSYLDKNQLLLHQPSWNNEEAREEFVQTLHHAYLDVRQSAKTYFVNLASVRERACYSMKIPEYLFDQFLERAYHERLKIRIALEVDRSPQEMQVMYLRREPVMIDGKYRNIIAIDLA